ncbi:hypothetical protein HY630_02445 [Candidatus Uhrbacteria bacterium]|nr:hypothetical protein [Candidatus Uhrbacteria bacterium]
MTDPARFLWPDPKAPRVVTRDLTLLRARKRRKKGEPKPQPLVLRGIKLNELIPHCLYEVPVGCFEGASAIRELKSGSILSRNLKVSERLNGGPPEEEWKQCFVSYDGVHKARRGVGHADRRYRSREIPANKRLAGTLDELVRTSWELHKVDEDGREAFVLIAVQAAKKYGKPIDETKRRAQARTLQAGTLTDTKGRFNPGRIPLICFAGEHEIASRIQAVRGIGRRMSFREAVLEHYIDRLREIVRDLSRSQQYRLRAEWLAHGPGRTPKKVKEEADRLEDAAKRLRAIVSRPFSRSFTRSADDLDAAAKLLREAAGGRNGDTILDAKELIGQVFRATVQQECHWRLEEVLLQLGILEDRGEKLESSRQLMWHDELRAVHRKLVSVEPITGKRLEHGFKGPVLQRVVPNVHLADVHLMRVLAQGGPDLVTMKDHLDKAVAPL